MYNSSPVHTCVVDGVKIPTIVQSDWSSYHAFLRGEEPHFTSVSAFYRLACISMEMDDPGLLEEALSIKGVRVNSRMMDNEGAWATVIHEAASRLAVNHLRALLVCSDSLSLKLHLR